MGGTRQQSFRRVQNRGQGTSSGEAGRPRGRKSEPVDDLEGPGTRTKKEEQRKVAVLRRRNGSGRLEREFGSLPSEHARVQEHGRCFRQKEVRRETQQKKQ